MTYHKLRHEAIELADKLTFHRSDLLRTISQINVSISKLVAFADSIALRAADEISSNPRVTQVTYSAKTRDIAAAARKQRICRGCNEPGHDKRNCPKAAETYKHRRKK